MDSEVVKTSLYKATRQEEEEILVIQEEDVKFKLWRWYILCPEVNKENWKAMTVMIIISIVIIRV